MHPLHDPAWVEEIRRSTGFYPGARRTGRTTALALHYLSMAIRNPRVPQVVQDHHPTPQAARYLLGRAKEIADTIGLQHMTFDRNKNTVTFG